MQPEKSRENAGRVHRIKRWRLFYHILGACFMIAACGPLSASTITPSNPDPTEEVSQRGIGDTLYILHPQAPDLLNPHLSSSIKDLEPSRITYEPLASFNNKGQLVPILAEEIPSIENGEVAEDGKSVTWKLRKDILWSDGEKFTADDVLFTYQFISNPNVNATSATIYSSVESVEVVDTFMVKVVFKNAIPFWAVPFVGIRGVILPRHAFEEYNNADARLAPANILPVGTGPYRAVAPGLKPQEILLLGTSLVKTNRIIFEPNPFYRDPNKPFFKRIEYRGGGKPDEAARSLEKGEVDFVYDVGFLPLKTLSELNSQGLLVTLFGSNVYRILLNHTEPNQETENGERSSSKIPHRFFSDIRVRQAFAYAIDRQAIAAQYGPVGRPVTNNLVTPPQFSSPNILYTFDLEKAKSLLEEAGWMLTGSSEVRQKDDIKLQAVIQSYSGADSIIQNLQLIKANLESIGVDVEIKLTDASIMFGPCASNPDSAWCFNADMMYFYVNSASPDPSTYMETWMCKYIPHKNNNWTGNNFERWCNKTYDQMFESSSVEIDSQKRAQIFMDMNDLLLEEVVMIPVVLYADVQGVNPEILGVNLTPWDAYTWNIAYWRRITP